MRIYIENKELEVNSITATYRGISYYIKPERVEGVVLSASKAKESEDEGFGFGLIPVYMALPINVIGDVLCFTRRRKYIIARHLGAGIWSSECDGEEVTHWCYLPKVPKEENK
jgi:hypothetical protein